MKRRYIPLISALLMVPMPVWATGNEIKRGPVPDWAHPSEPLAVPASPSGAIFFRRQDVAVHLDKTGQAQYLGYRIKILNSAAMQAGNIGISWNPTAGQPIVHTVRLYRDGQAIDVLAKTSFEILRREEQLELAQLNGALTAVLRVPDVRVGDELEFEATIPRRDATLGLHDAGLIFLAPDPVPGRYRLSVSWEGERHPTVRPSGDIAGQTIAQRQTVEYKVDNPPIANIPNNAPPRYNWRRLIEFSDFPDWPSVSQFFAPLYARAAELKPSSPLRIEAARIRTANATPLERARAALKLVQQDVRYIYVGLDGGNLTPASADETWQRRYGDCKGKTALLLALLTELGIKGEAVLVNVGGGDDGLEQRLPGPQHFDHVLVRAQIDGKGYWLDGTLPPVARPSLAPITPIRWVLPLAMTGARLEDLGWRPSSNPDEINLFEVDARTGFDKPARITSTTIIRGIKGLQQQAELGSVSAAQLQAAVQQKVVGSTWQSIDKVEWRYDEKAQASVLTIAGLGMPDWDDDGGGKKSLTLAGGGAYPPERRVRPAGQDVDAPFYTAPESACFVTTVRVPSQTSKKQWSVNADYDQFYFGRRTKRIFGFADGSARMVRVSRVEQREFSAETARRDNAQIAVFDNNMADLRFDPNGTATTFGAGKDVPATYDLDWTAAVTPCSVSPTS